MYSGVKSYITSGGSFPFGRLGDSPFNFPDREKKCQNISRSGNKMIIFYIPQHFAPRINTRDETIRSSHDTIRIDTKGDDMVIFDTIRYG